MKFLHSADVHLDSPLRGLARYPGAPVERLRGASREALERLVRLAVGEGVAFVVIAGDLYDGERDDFQTAMFLQHQLHVLRSAGIAVVIAYGNHDAANEITTRLDFPDGVHRFPDERAATTVLADAGVALHGRSYPTRAVVEDLSAAYPSPVGDLLNVGVLHTSLDGRAGHDPYAPCTLDGLVRRGYDYWALGHVHLREHLVRDGVHVVFPGNLQGRDVGETGSKGATLVVYDGGGVRAVEHRELAPVRWSVLDLDLRGETGMDAVFGEVAGRLEALRQSSDADLHAVRIRLRVSPSVSHEWLRWPERYDAQLRADAAGGSDDLWLERIEVLPAVLPASEVPGEAVGAVRDAVAALRTGAEAPGWSDVRGMLAGLRSRFGRDLEGAVRLGAGVLEEASFPDLLDEVEALLVAELEAGA